MWKFVLSVISLAWITACGPIPAYGQSFRIATFNVNYANTRGDQVLDAISEASPDILCLQETTLQSEGWLRKQLADSHPEFPSAGHEGKYYAERFAFASKLEPVELVYHPPKAGLFGFYEATYTVHNRKVRIVNVHLSPFGIPRGAGLTDALAAISKTEAKHSAEIDAILDSIDPETPTVICGDFNSLSTFKAPSSLVENGFIDSFASLHNNPDQHVTWNWPSRPIPLRFRIDYIFHSKHFQTIESAVIEKQGSDHFMVVSELKFVK